MLHVLNPQHQAALVLCSLFHPLMNQAGIEPEWLLLNCAFDITLNTRVGICAHVFVRLGS